MAELWDILDASGHKTGRLHERGTPMNAGDYHLVVHVWIMNRDGHFLISKRTPGITGWAGLWQTTGGSAVAGDDSLTTALKETSEEIGVALDPKNGRLFKRYHSPHTNDSGGAHYDVWLFRQEIDLSAVVFQPDETCGAMWASREMIRQMVDEGVFMPDEAYPYLDELFRFCDKPFLNMTNEPFWQTLDTLVAESEIVIDRPKGSVHPRYPNFIYPLDYGYLKDSTSPDGGGIDVWRGSGPAGEIDAIMCTVDLAKRDSEMKILIGCTEDEKAQVYQIHNEMMKGILIRR